MRLLCIILVLFVLSGMAASEDCPDCNVIYHELTQETGNIALDYGSTAGSEAFALGIIIPSEAPVDDKLFRRVPSGRIDQIIHQSTSNIGGSGDVSYLNKAVQAGWIQGQDFIVPICESCAEVRGGYILQKTIQSIDGIEVVSFEGKLRILNADSKMAMIVRDLAKMSEGVDI
ncbi:MAG: hypothetical protein H5T42_00020 [Methanothrix sp.]|jgi:hypothetical protein|uniref:hypothetical protein n=1 Tax=Methanothrix sp. TaxID=90426 RepID=UPI0019A887A1|nr:hypothetical protein [Methanothrix sp.]MBC7078857.1 hypothetical protein [Methanothrix sp.]NPU87020.1 hypothetical protein [Methanothrix sp.]